jgi:putative ABC transport system substrate-binding protein
VARKAGQPSKPLAGAFNGVRAVTDYSSLYRPGIDRRRFLLTSLAGALTAPLAAKAQQAGKVYRIGVLHPGSGSEERLAALREAGYVEGQNFVAERRHAQGRVERLPELARELVGLKPDIILATSNSAIQAAKDATKSIPIVMAFSDDPVALRLVASLAQPGGNVTGVTLTAAGTLAAKRVELLKAAVPRARRIALLDWPRADATMSAPQVQEAQLAARSLTLETVLVEVRDGDYERAFATVSAERADALLVLSHPILNRDRKRIIALAARYRLPAIYEWRESAEEGGFIAYGANIRDLNRRVATFVDKILKGAKPGDLPIEQPTKFELVINLKTAKALGITIPPSLLARADQVIE